MSWSACSWRTAKNLLFFVLSGHSPGYPGITSIKNSQWRKGGCVVWQFLILFSLLKAVQKAVFLQSFLACPLGIISVLGSVSVSRRGEKREKGTGRREARGMESSANQYRVRVSG